MNYVLCALAGFLLVPTQSAAQDPKIRSEAEQLLEKANGVSMSPKLPNLERTDVFHVLDTSSPVREGTFTRVVLQGVGRREETTFGDYHTIEVGTHAGLKAVRTSELAPAEVDTVMTITPILHVDFADDDVIHAIVDKAGTGEQKLRCIEFDTIRGKRIENNEICADAASGTFVSQKIGSDLIEYSKFFPFAGGLLPAEINYSTDGVRKLEITQTMVELKDAAENVLAAPPNADLRQGASSGGAERGTHRLGRGGAGAGAAVGFRACCLRWTIERGRSHVCRAFPRTIARTAPTTR